MDFGIRFIEKHRSWLTHDPVYLSLQLIMSFVACSILCTLET